MRFLITKALLLSLVFLAGCQPKSDVDKCIEAKWELFELLQKQAVENKVILDIPLPKETALEIKMDHRMQCLHGSKIN
jgi:hypothetical protein